MYEFTHQGLWFKWGALDRREKGLVGGSFVLLLPATLLLGIWAGSSVEGVAFGLGYWAGSGGSWPTSIDHTGIFDRLTGWRFYPAFVALSLAGAAAGVALWLKFSSYQDEMFHRFHVYVVGVSSTATLCLLAAWAALASAGWTPPVAFNLLTLVWLVIALVAIVRAYRRWA